MATATSADDPEIVRREKDKGRLARNECDHTQYLSKVLARCQEDLNDTKTKLEPGIHQCYHCQYNAHQTGIRETTYQLLLDALSQILEVVDAEFCKHLQYHPNTLRRKSSSDMRDSGIVDSSPRNSATNRSSQERQEENGIDLLTCDYIKDLDMTVDICHRCLVYCKERLAPKPGNCYSCQISQAEFVIKEEIQQQIEALKNLIEETKRELSKHLEHHPPVPIGSVVNLRLSIEETSDILPAMDRLTSTEIMGHAANAREQTSIKEH